MLNTLKDFIEELEKDYSTITVNENNEYKGYITIKYTQEDLDLLTDEELAEFNSLLKNYYYAPGTVKTNKRYNLKEQTTIYDEIEFNEIEFRLKGVA